MATLEDSLKTAGWKDYDEMYDAIRAFEREFLPTASERVMLRFNQWKEEGVTKDGYFQLLIDIHKLGRR